MKNQNRLALILVVLSILGLIFQEDIWDWLKDFARGNDGRPVVASIDEISNTVRYRYPDTLSWRKAKAGVELRDNDTISTDPESTAVVTFKSGLKVQLEPNSLIVVHNYGGPDTLELTFLKGGVKVLGGVPGPAIPIPEEKIPKPTKIDLAAIPIPTPSVEPPKKIVLEEKKAKPSATPRPKKQLRESLPDSYIALVIRGQRNLLDRCYGQHLRLNPQARGRIDTLLTIEPDGTISSARVVASSISDPVLQQCVITVLQRAKFRPYDGDPIVVNYPINFE